MAIDEITTEFEGAYGISEAARYLHADIRVPGARYKIRSRHLIRWVRLGLADPGLVQIPGRQLVITFEDLISMRVIAFLRTLNYSFPKIHRAEAVIRESTGYPRPFATDDIWAETNRGEDIYAEMASVLLAATRSGQLAFKELIQENLINVHGLTFNEKNIAASWEPRKGILLHPRIQFGRSCIAGTRIPTSDLAGMAEAGDSVEYLAASYSITQEQVEQAIAWESELATV